MNSLAGKQPNLNVPAWFVSGLSVEKLLDNNHKCTNMLTLHIDSTNNFKTWPKVKGKRKRTHNINTRTVNRWLTQRRRHP
jgi:hypothetical protein